ncbi:MAG: isoprenylcysteine carboxylmethyltransferase family protein [Acidobacteriota bacterium]
MRLFLKNLFFTVFVPGTVAGFLPWFLASGDRVSGWLALVAGFLFGFGAVVYLWCLWDFATFGRGTPAPVDAPKRLVVRGLYRYSRNPMYVGVLGVVAGWVVWFGGQMTLVVYLVLLFVAFHLRVVLHEEPSLREQFGPEYTEYRSKVARWLPVPF